MQRPHGPETRPVLQAQTRQPEVERLGRLLHRERRLQRRQIDTPGLGRLQCAHLARQMQLAFPDLAALDTADRHVPRVARIAGHVVDRAVVRDHERRADLHVADAPARRVGMHGRGDLQQGLHIPGRRHDRHAGDHVILEVGQRLVFEIVDPDVGSRMLLAAEQRQVSRAHALVHRALGLEPGALALPRIGGERREAARAVERSPVDRAAAREHLRHRAMHARALGLVAPQGLDHADFLRMLFRAVAQRARQHGVRADLDERDEAVVEQRLDRPEKGDRLAHVQRPVVGAERRPRRAPAGHGRDQRQRGLAGHARPQRCAQFVEDRIHQVAVIRHLDGQHAVEHLLRAQRVRERLDRGRLARQRQRVRAVDGRDLDAPGERREPYLHLARAEPDGQHAAAARRQRLQAAAFVADAQRILQAQRAAHAGRGDLAHAVAHHRARLDARGAEQRGEPPLDHEVRGLGVGSARDLRFGLALQHLGDDRETRDPLEDEIRLVHHRPVQRLVAIQFLAHRPPWRPHPGEHPDRLGAAERGLLTGDHVLRMLALRERVEPAPQLCAIGARHDGAVRERRALERGRVQQIREIRIGRRQLRVVAVRQRLERRAAARRQRQIERKTGRTRRRRRHGARRRDGRRRAQHHVRVGAAVAERIDGGKERLAGRGERDRRVGEAHADLLERNARMRALQVAERERLAVHQRQHRLDHADDARTRFQMADVALDRAEHDARVAAPVRAVDRSDRSGLDRIADRRTRAVALDIAHLRRIDFEPLADFPDQQALRLAARHRDAGGAAVGIDARARDGREDRIAVGQRPLERLEHHDAAAFAAAVAVAAGVERFALPVARQELPLAHADRVLGARHDVRAADHGHVALAGPDVAAGIAERDQRRRTGGVDRQARPAQVERMRQAIGEHRHHHARRGVGVVAGAVRHLHQRDHVVEHEAADIDAHLPACVRGQVEPGVLERLPDQFEQEPLLRIEVLRDARRQIEELRIHRPYVLAQEVPLVDVGLALRAFVGCVIASGIPSVRRDGPRGHPARAQRGQQAVEIVNSPWKPTGHPHHRDFFHYSSSKII